MDTHEGAFVIVVEGRSGGAMRLVTDHQVKGIQTVIMLSAADDIDGVIGREHNAHVVGVMALEHFSG